MKSVLRLSNSEMNTFRRCKRQWWLRYYRELAPKEVEFGTPSSLGTLVHSGLEALYSIPNQDPLEAVRMKSAADLEKWPVREEGITADMEMAVIMLEGYLQWLEEEGADANIRLLTSGEASRAVSLGGPLRTSAGVDVPVVVMAKLDSHVLDVTEDSVWALEHKTVQSLDAPLMGLKINTQALTQHLVEFLMMKQENVVEENGTAVRRADGTLWNMLRKVKRTARAKPPFYGRIPVRHNVDELRSHWFHVVGIAQEIIDRTEMLDNGSNPHIVAYPSPTMDCHWSCDFFRICCLFDDGSDAEGALRDLYTTIDPLERYADGAAGTEI